MKTLIKFLMVLLLLGFCHVSMADLAKKKTYIVHMAKSEMPSRFEHHSHWYDSSLKSVSNSAEILYTYDNVIHGYSTRLTPEEAEALENQPGTLSVLPELRYELHTTRTPEFLGLGKSTDMYRESNSASEVIIGVLDTGVWPESKSYDDTGFGSVPSAALPGKLLPFVYAGNASNATNGNLCMMGTLTPEKVAGKIVMCDRGLSARVQKGAVVKAAGGLGMVLANTAANGEELVADAHLLPATTINMVARKKLTCEAGKKYSVTDLNYPSFAVNIDTTQGSGPTAVKYTRTLTNVGSPGTYKLSLTSENPQVKISVQPAMLSFSQVNEKKSYTVTFTVSSSMPSIANSFARIEWSDGKHIVGSPIAISWT
ncbi:hypothetical protein Q3G72_031088 [Acer saccharum]|nr:hypothetical protein Q3G72_031088 [Acer saccharum]